MGHEEALGAWEASETATVADAYASELAVSSCRYCSDLKGKNAIRKITLFNFFGILTCCRCRKKCTKAYYTRAEVVIIV